MIAKLPVFLLLGAASVCAADISGTWKVDLNVAGNAITLDCQLKQTGAQLSGVCKGGDRPDRNVTGEVKDQAVSFHYDFDLDGNKMTANYSGTLNSQGTAMKGTVEVQGNSGDFTASKQ